MESILYVGMDVHTTNYTLCTYSIETDKEFGLVKFGPDYQNIMDRESESSVDMKQADWDIPCIGP